jgi:hypothetical protein
MARAAFLLDKLMSGVGLHGKAFLPLMSSFACAIPGIMATRTIENPKDRLATILIAPFMSCSARLPVYALDDRDVFRRSNRFRIYFARRGFDAGDVCARHRRGDHRRVDFKTNALKSPPPPFVMELAAVSSAEFAHGFAKYVHPRRTFSEARRNGDFGDFDYFMGADGVSAKRERRHIANQPNQIAPGT